MTILPFLLKKQTKTVLFNLKKLTEILHNVMIVLLLLKNIIQLILYLPEKFKYTTSMKNKLINI